MRKKDDTPKKRKPQVIQYVINNLRSTMKRSLFKTVRKLQTTSHFLIPKLPFSRVIRELMMEFADDLRIQKQALEALQDAAETYVVHLLNDANRCSAHAKRVTVHPKDMQLVLDLRGPSDPGVFGNERLKRT